MQANFDWIALLEKYGDPFELKGLRLCNLGSTFPRYAELWAKYVLTNRDPLDPSKLSPKISPQVEDVFNNHYGVFYQLTFALNQLNNINNPLIDVATPLLHLGTSVDLTKRTFIAALFALGNIEFKPLEKAEYDSQIENFWSKSYTKGVDDFLRSYRPVQVTLHSIDKLFEQHIKHKDFRNASEQVRQYRNLMIHSLPPLKVEIDGVLYLPKVQSLNSYKDARWSSNRYKLKKEDYDSAESIIRQLAANLISSMNNLWQTLLKLMEQLLPEMNQSEIMRRISGVTSSPESVRYINRPATASGVNFEGNVPATFLPNMHQFGNENYFGGSANYIPYLKTTHQSSMTEPEDKDEQPPEG